MNCGDKKIVKSITSIPDKNKLTAMYIINYEPGGFAILSADKRMVPILAYSADNNLAESSGNRPPNLEFWLNCIKENIESIRSDNEAPTKEILYEWKNFENEENNNYLKLKSGNPEPGPCCTDTVIEKDHMLSTKWHQGCGFNSLLRQRRFIGGCVNESLNCGYAYAGCTAIAMAQVMKFYQYPTSYNWSQMPNQMPTVEPYPTEPARLIAAIDAKDALDPDFKCDGTGANLLRAAYVLKNKFGYSSATYASYNYNTVLLNVSNNKPVIIGGGNGTEGHAWVCDGFRQSKSCMYDDYGNCMGSVVLLWFKMNWGYEGQGDAYWYGFNNFNPTIDGEVNNFNLNVDMVYNITP